MSQIYSEYIFKDGDLTVNRVQDVEPILDKNKWLQTVAQPWAGTFRHVATIPNVILEKWINEEGAPVLSMSKQEFSQFIKKKLNDPDWRYLKTTADARI
jgi:hypothetical protein